MIKLFEAMSTLIDGYKNSINEGVDNNSVQSKATEIIDNFDPEVVDYASEKDGYNVHVKDKNSDTDLWIYMSVNDNTGKISQTFNKKQVDDTSSEKDRIAYEVECSPKVLDVVNELAIDYLSKNGEIAQDRAPFGKWKRVKQANTEKIKESLCKLVETYNECRIYESEGSIIADVNGARQTASTVEAMREKIDAIKSHVCESHTLTEGPGAGYTIQANVKFGPIEANTISIVDKSDLSNVRVECSIPAIAENIKFYSYDYGSEINEECEAELTEILVDYENFVADSRYAGEETFTDDPTPDAIKELLEESNGGETDHIYGGGYMHSTYDGTLSDVKNEWKDLKGNWYYVNGASIRLLNEEDIKYIDDSVSGETLKTYYGVTESPDEPPEDEFNYEEEAIECAKKYNYAYVVENHYIEDREGDLDYYDYYEYNKVVWENNELPEADDDVDEFYHIHKPARTEGKENCCSENNTDRILNARKSVTEDNKDQVIRDIRKGNLHKNDEVDGLDTGSDDDYYVQFQDRTSNSTAYSGKTDDNGNIVGMGRKLDKHPRQSSHTWGRVWKNGKLDKQFEGPKYKVRQDVVNHLSKTEGYSEEDDGTKYTYEIWFDGNCISDAEYNDPYDSYQEAYDEGYDYVVYLIENDEGYENNTTDDFDIRVVEMESEPIESLKESSTDKDFKQIKSNAIRAAKRDGYDQIVSQEDDGSYTIGRSYPGNKTSGKRVGKVSVGYKNGVQTADYLDESEYLHPEFDPRNSFYRKAYTDTDKNGDIVLYSYDTLVCKIHDNKVLLYPKWNWTQTTLRHVKEFLKQHGFKADSLKQMSADYLNESKINEYQYKHDDDDKYFRAFITNLGKYNEGELVGNWVDFPMDEDEFQEELKKIGVSNEPDENGEKYEEWFVTDYDCPFDVYQDLGEYPGYELLNEYGDMIVESTDSVTAIENAYEVTGNLKEAIEGLEDGDIIFYEGPHDWGEFAEQYIEEVYGDVDKWLDDLDSTTLERHLDFEALGRDLSFDTYEDDDGNDTLNAGEFFCGDAEASDYDIGEEFYNQVGMEGISNPSYYFDWDSYGNDFQYDRFSLTKDGVIEDCR